MSASAKEIRSLVSRLASVEQELARLRSQRRRFLWSEVGGARNRMSGADTVSSKRLTAVRASARGILLLVGLALGGGLFLSFALAGERHVESIEASTFRVVDENGKVRALLGLVEMAEGTAGAPQVARGQVPFLALYDAQGRQRAEFQLTLDGSPRLYLAPQPESAGIEMKIVSGYGAARLRLFHGTKPGSIEMLLHPQGSPHFIVTGQDGEVLKDVK